MERATKQTRSIQVHCETVPDSGVNVELTRAATAEIKTIIPRELNCILPFFFLNIENGTDRFQAI